jgi:hypothetical protein
MGDYLDYFDRDSEKSEDSESQKTFSTASGSNISLDEYEIEQKKQRALKVEYDNLLDDKYKYILNYNDGHLDSMFFFRFINDINARMDAMDFTDLDINEELAQKENLFNQMMEEFILKIKSKRKENKRQRSGFLTKLELKRLEFTRKEVLKLRTPEELPEDILTLETELQKQKLDKKKEAELLELKYNTIVAFNNGDISRDEYINKIIQINEDLSILEFQDIHINEEIAKQEIAFTSIVEDLSKKIESALQKPNLKSKTKGFLDSFDITRLQSAKTILEKLKTIKPNEAEGVDVEVKPFDYDSFDLESLVYRQRKAYEYIGEKQGLVKPNPDTFENDSAYQQALVNYYDQLKIILLFRPFGKKEELEIKTIAKKYNIDIPTTPYEYKIFLNEVGKLLPGYLLTINPTRLELQDPYKSVNVLSLKNKILADLEKSESENVYLPQHMSFLNEHQDLDKVYLYLRTKPIPIDEEDEFIQNKYKVFGPILDQLSKDQLIDCIFNKSNVEEYSVPQQPKKLNKVELLRKGIFPEYTFRNTPIKLKTLSTEEGSLKPTISKKFYIPENVEDISKLKALKHELQPEDYLEYINSRNHRGILKEVLQMYKKFQERKVVKKLTQQMQNAPPPYQPEFIPKGIVSRLRKVSKQRLLAAIKIDLEPELLPFCEETITRLEDYIHKISEDNFVTYSNKIEDILFIFENYPGFKVKLLAPIPNKKGIYVTDINIYQIALFDKEINYEARLHIFPVKVSIRRAVIKKLIYEFAILGHYRFERNARMFLPKRAKILEMMIFNLSKNETNYISNVKKLIEIIRLRGKDILTNEYTPEEIIQTIRIFNKNDKKQKKLFDRYLNETDKGSKMENITYKEFIKRILPEPVNHYSEYSAPELKALMNAYQENLNELNKTRKKLDSENYEGDYLIYWIPPDIVPVYEKQKWENLVSNYILTKDKSIFTQLNEMKQSLSKRYRFSASPEHMKLIGEIIDTEYTLTDIVKEYNKKINKEQELATQNYIKTLREKNELPVQQLRESVYTYNVQMTPQLVTEVVNAYKRNLILNIPDIFKVYSNVKVVDNIFIENYDFKPYVITTQLYDQHPEKTNKNIIITYMEMYDVNEYYNNLKLYGVSSIESSLYNSVKNYLATMIDNYITKDYKSIERQYFKIALRGVADFLNIQLPDTSLSQQVEHLANNWPKNYEPQKQIVDYYSQDLFGKLLVSNYRYPGVTEPPILKNMDPLDFYNIYILRNYEIIVKKSKKTSLQEFRRYGILFNEATGLYGDQAYDGVLYPVEKLDKDFTTGNPIAQVQIVAERDPRTGEWLPVQRTTYKRGPYAFIKRYLGTSQIGKLEEIWHEVPAGSVRLYKTDYDSCERFNSKQNCKGLGMSGKPCEWNDILRKCKASAFGKVMIKLRKDTSGVKYKLSDTQAKRRKSLVKRVNHEKKKKKNLRQAAIAVKRRLVVLRTYNKKNKKLSKVLSSDIKYIDNKYLK